MAEQVFHLLRHSLISPPGLMKLSTSLESVNLIPEMIELPEGLKEKL